MRRSRTDTLFIATLAGIIVAGMMVRSWGVLVGVLDFWADEALWATYLIQKSVLDHGTRPVGFMAVSRVVASLTDPTVGLRLLSLIAGVGTLVVAAIAARLLFRSRTAVIVAVFIFAFHPKLIVFAKEFKPYSVEAFVHTGLLCWALLSHRRGRATNWFWIAAASAPLFAYNIVFLYPSIVAANGRRWLTRLLTGSAAVYNRYTIRERALLAVASVAALGLVYSIMYQLSGAARRRAFWGEKYDVFPIGLNLWEGIVWYAHRTWELIAMPAGMNTLSPALGPILTTLVVASIVAGVAILLRERRHIELLLLTGPLALTVFANVLGFWPYGAFRTNLFLLPGLILTACVGIDLLAAWRPRAALVPAVAVVIMCLPVDLSQFRVKRMADWAPSPQHRLALDQMQARMRTAAVRRNHVILTDWHSWQPLQYYMTVDPPGRESYAQLRENSRLVRGALNNPNALVRQLTSEYNHAVTNGIATRVWIVVTKLDEFDPIRTHPLVERFRTSESAFATHDTRYHPILIELQF